MCLFYTLVLQSDTILLQKLIFFEEFSFWLNIDKSNQIRPLTTDSIIFNDFKRLNYITVLSVLT